jgi:hypothetical protein
MKVYPENLIGSWHHKEKNRIYTFRKSGIVYVKSANGRQMIYDFQIITRQGNSLLVIDEFVFPFINMTPYFFSLRVKQNIIILTKIVDE